MYAYEKSSKPACKLASSAMQLQKKNENMLWFWKETVGQQNDINSELITFWFDLFLISFLSTTGHPAFFSSRNVFDLLSFFTTYVQWCNKVLHQRRIFFGPTKSLELIM